MMTIKQASDELGISTKTLRRWEEDKYFVPERESNTGFRFYDPYIIGYWKRMLDLDRALKKHLELLDGVRKELDKHMLSQDYHPGRPLKLMDDHDIEEFTKASDAMEKWEKDFRYLLDELIKYPKPMLKATTEKYDEK